MLQSGNFPILAFLVDLHVVRCHTCLNHNFTVFEECLFVYIYVCDKNFERVKLNGLHTWRFLNYFKVITLLMLYKLCISFIDSGMSKNFGKVLVFVKS